MSADVCLAAMMPARRAVCSGSPLAIPPRRIRRSAAALITISPRASASRLVTGLAPTSTIRALPFASRCESLRAEALAEAGLPAIAFSLGEVEREALERHREIHALQLHVPGDLQRSRREIEDRLDSSADHLLDNRLRVRSGHSDDGDVEPPLFRHALQLLDVVNRHAAARLVADLLVGRIEQRGNLEAFLAEARVIGQGEAEVSGAHDRDAEMAIETQNLAEVAAQLLDVVPHASHAEFPEVREVLADLRGIEVELFGQRLRGDRLHAGGIELVQAAQIHGQAVRRQFRHLVGGLPPLVRTIHKVQWYRKVQ